MVIASPRDDGPSDSGALYVYQYQPSTDAWVETKIKASDASGSDYLGKSLGISGNTIVAGSYKNSSWGGVYVYEYDPSDDTWAETYLIGSDSAIDDRFGNDFAVSGITILIGAEGDDDNGATSGSVYLYQYQPSTENWV